VKPSFMATRTKRKTASKKTQPRKKTAAKKQRTSKSRQPEPALPPKKRAIALHKLRRLSIRPSYPSAELGPTLNLSFDAPIKVPRANPRKTKRKKRSA
jgi:hypothetical protein